MQRITFILISALVLACLFVYMDKFYHPAEHGQKYVQGEIVTRLLREEGYIHDSDNYTLHITQKELLVDGNKLPDSLFQRIRSAYIKTADPDLNFTMRHHVSMR